MRLTPLRTLNKPSQFHVVRHRGKNWHTSHFVISVYSADNQTDHAIGFIVTKKMYKRAIDRNRVKRKLRPIAREILPTNASAGDYVLIAKPSCMDAPHEVLKKDMLWALKKLQCNNT